MADQDDQIEIPTNLTSSIERLRRMCFKKEMSDVKFMVGLHPNQKSFFANRFVLSMSSQVFDTMFSSQWTNGKKEYTILDESPEAFEQLLKWLYGDRQVNLTLENIEEVLYSVRKYAVQEFEEHCFLFLNINLRFETAFRFYEYGVFFQIEQLTENCWIYIQRNMKCLLKDASFREVNVATVKMLVKKYQINVEEVELFKAILQWADAECKRRQIESSIENKRTVLQGILNHIRFPLINLEDFVEIVLPTGILTKSQINSMVNWYSEPEKNWMLDFPLERTSKPCGHEFQLERFAQLYVRCEEKQSLKVIRFTVDRNIYLTGVALYGTDKGFQRNRVLVGSYKNVLTSKGTIVVPSFENKLHRCDFKEKKMIFANQPVQIWNKLVDKSCVFEGQEGQSNYKVKVDHNEYVNFTFHSLDENGKSASVQSGQIPIIYFKTY